MQKEHHNESQNRVNFIGALDCRASELKRIVTIGVRFSREIGEADSQFLDNGDWCKPTRIA